MFCLHCTQIPTNVLTYITPEFLHSNRSFLWLKSNPRLELEKLQRLKSNLLLELESSKASFGKPRPMLLHFNDKRVLNVHGKPMQLIVKF